MQFSVDLITYRGLYKTIETDKLNLPTSDGRRTILSNHMPVIMPIELGVIETHNDEGLFHYASSDGMVFFENNKATIVCDTIIDINEADISYYEERLAAAKKELKQARNDEDIKRANIKILRATNILKHSKNHKV